MTKLLTQHIVISKGDNDNFVYGWWYPGADFSFVVGTADPDVTLANIAKHIKEEWPDVTVHRRPNLELETTPDIPDDEDMEGYEPNKKELRTLMRNLVRIQRENT